MYNHHNKTLIYKASDLESYFKNPSFQRQRQYEVIRAVIMENLPIPTVAKNFGYKSSTVYSLLRDVKAGNIELFPELQKGPQERRILKVTRDKIITLRKQQLSSKDIYNKLSSEKMNISVSTVERVLKDAGFDKLKRRTNREMGKTIKNKIISQRVAHLDFDELEPFNVDCPSVGAFFFLPYILESGILDVVKRCKLPESSDIDSTNACLSMLLLKLIGNKRLSHIGTYDQEPGLGSFAGLNILPKQTYMNTYSCRCSEAQLMKLQKDVISHLQKKFPLFYKSDFINLDFHSIPHYGDESQMEKVWCGARGKSMKGANTIVAQDSQSNMLIYTKADILRREESNEIKKFVNYWKTIKGDVNETLVFDCKLTTYNILDELADDHVKFITLRKRNATLLKDTVLIPKKEWKKIYLNIPKRKHKRISVHEKEITFRGCKNTFRQITIKDHGRLNPTFVITNNKDLPLKDVLKVYAKRWRVENKLAEMIAFFNLNALSSPLMIRIHFDILWTMVADTLYHIFAQDLRRFENNLSPTIFKKFIDMPGRVIFDGEKFLIKIRKRSHTPILMGIEKLQAPFKVPWLGNKTMEIVWTA